MAPAHLRFGRSSGAASPSGQAEQLQVGQAARQQLLESIAQATDDAGGLLAASVLELVSRCRATHLLDEFLEVSMQWGTATWPSSTECLSCCT